MTLEEKFIPDEIERLKVELEQARVHARYLAAVVMYDLSTQGNPASAIALSLIAPHLVEAADKELQLSDPKVPLYTGEILSHVEAVLTPDTITLRQLYNKVK